MVHSEQVAVIRKFRNEGLPKGIDRAEIWVRLEPKRIAVRPPASAEEPSPEEIKMPNAKTADESPDTIAAKELPSTPPSTIAEFVARNTPPADELG